MEKEITIENVFNTNIPQLALDSRFGSLVFENANKKLTKIQEWLKEVYALGYEDFLTQEDISQVNSITNELIGHLEWLRKFDISIVSNAKQEHDAFEKRVEDFFKPVYSQILMRILLFLREERRRENPDQKQIDEEVKKVVKIRTELEDELRGVREETLKIRATNKAVSSAKGERAAVRLAGHFDEEVLRYEKLSKYWLIGVAAGYVVIVGILIWLGVITTSYITKIISSVDTATVSGSGIWSGVISKLVILAALWYGLSFVIKNYNVNSHLSAVNRHRAAVASTLEDFIAVEQQQEKPRLSEVLQNASEAMFKNMPVGYVSKTEKESGNPVLQVINDLMGIRNNG